MQLHTPLQEQFDNNLDSKVWLTVSGEESSVKTAGRHVPSTVMQSAVGKDKDYVPPCRPFWVPRLYLNSHLPDMSLPLLHRRLHLPKRRKTG